MPTYCAIWNDVVIAESDASIIVDGYRRGTPGPGGLELLSRGP